MKWYDVIKGYGFVVPDRGGPDIMVHASCVRAFGRMALADNAAVRLVAAQGERGLHAVELLEVEETADPEQSVEEEPAAPRPTEFLDPEAATGPLCPARVKWFDKQKGSASSTSSATRRTCSCTWRSCAAAAFPTSSSGEGMACAPFAARAG